MQKNFSSFKREIISKGSCAVEYFFFFYLPGTHRLSSFLCTRWRPCWSGTRAGAGGCRAKVCIAPGSTLRAGRVFASRHHTPRLARHHSPACCSESVSRQPEDDQGPILREALALEQKYPGATCGANLSLIPVKIFNVANSTRKLGYISTTSCSTEFLLRPKCLHKIGPVPDVY